MPVATSYPGIYIEELPSTERTIAAAPTSITVFIGYSHPYKTKAADFGRAIRIRSFTDYENAFGGFFRSNRTPTFLPLAVNQFFLNGGSDCYVIGLGSNGLTPASFATDTNAANPRLVLTAMEPTDTVKMEVTLEPKNSGTEADITVTYGTRAETYRRVPFSKVESVLSGGDPGSLLKITIEHGLASFTSATAVSKQALQESGGTSVFDATQITAVFGDNQSLDKVDIFNLMAIPGITDNSVLSAALSYCEKKRAFYIMDPPAGYPADGTPDLVAFVDGASVPKSQNGAIFFPYLVSGDPATGASIPQPPSGFVAGIFARTDNNRGVWKAPAGLETIINNTIGVPESGRLTDARAGDFNDAGINAIRTFPGVGTVVFGSRTLVTRNDAFQQWKYVPVRRTALFLEQTLKRNLGWVVFEPNDEPLWLSIRLSIEAFMLSLFRQGAFQGSTPSQAFLVKCDSSTTTQTDINLGRVNILVGFRPLKPAEFVIIKIAQLAGQAQA